MLRFGEQRAVRKTVRRQSRQHFFLLHLRRHEREQIRSVIRHDCIAALVHALPANEPAVVGVKRRNKVVGQAFAVLRKLELERNNRAHRVITAFCPATNAYGIIEPPQPPLVVTHTVQTVGYQPVVRPEQQVVVVIYIEYDFRIGVRERQQRIQLVLLKQRLELCKQGLYLRLAAQKGLLHPVAVSRQTVTCAKKHTQHANQHNKTYYF